MLQNFAEKYYIRVFVGNLFWYDHGQASHSSRADPVRTPSAPFFSIIIKIVKISMRIISKYLNHKFVGINYSRRKS